MINTVEKRFTSADRNEIITDFLSNLKKRGKVAGNGKKEKRLNITI